jgi:hypothetical protein
MIGAAEAGGSGYTATNAPVALSYYQQKIVEFQNLLNGMDAAAQAAQSALWDDIDPKLSADLQTYLDEFDSKKWEFKAAAEALNLAINGANLVGGDFPNITIPQTLGVVPLVAAGVIAAAVATAAALIVWGNTWLQGLNQRLRDQELIASVTDPAKRDKLIAAQIEVEQATVEASASPLSSISNIVKWLAIGAVAYFAFSAYKQVR